MIRLDDDGDVMLIIEPRELEPVWSVNLDVIIKKGERREA